jgi:hypothetical protein
MQSNSGRTVGIPYAIQDGVAPLPVNSFYIPGAVSRAHELVLATASASAYNNGASSYNCRLIGGSTKWSTHSWGVAVDLNSATNPLGQSYWNDQGGFPDYKKWGSTRLSVVDGLGFCGWER